MMWTALLMGLGGSLHCAGMCSPLVLAVTVFNKNVLLNRLVYNGGRIFIYGLLGIAMGGVGVLIDFAAFQNLFSLCLGIVLILIGFGTISSVHIPILSKIVNRFVRRIKTYFATALTNKTYSGLLLMGMLNGLLPCGLTYLAMAYTLTLNSLADSFLFMLVFGLSTIPVMIALPFVLQAIAKRFHVSFSKITTVMMISLGVLLIARTLSIHHDDRENARFSDDPVLCR